QDPRWGSLVDNLHVVFDRKRSGVGTALMIEAARIIAERADRRAMYLWVLEQNTAAQGFYRAVGGQQAERAPVPSPGGVPGRLNGAPVMIRFAWPDAVVAAAG
ncbi:MAG TPA: GNAT family N-acetyltransferase, partial [Microlunatus sp.]|nr:GNAT family N-acetyltransferase [Microlunatus sp.]